MGAGAHRSGWRRGSIASTDLALILAAIGAIGVTGAIVVPYSVRAGVERQAPAEVVPDDPALAAVHAGLMELVRRSHALLLVRDAPTPELALWANDEDDPGVVNAEEILVLRFNEGVGALAAYTRPPEEGDGSAPDETDGEGVPAAPRGLPPALVDGAVLDVWRRRPETERRVVAAGLEAFRVVTAPGGGNERAVRVHLVWGSPAADVPSMEGVFEVRLPRAGGASRPPEQAGGVAP